MSIPSVIAQGDEEGCDEFITDRTGAWRQLLMAVLVAVAENYLV